MNTCIMHSKLNFHNALNQCNGIFIMQSMFQYIMHPTMKLHIMIYVQVYECMYIDMSPSPF